MAHMTGYKMYSNCVDIYTSMGSTLRIYFNDNSGKVYYRYKIGSPTRIKHPGVYIGKDIHGTGYFVHNHYHVGSAHIATVDSFAQNMTLHIYHEYCTNSWDKVIEKALQQVMRGESYKPLSYNCQTMVNSACHNVRKSESADNFAKGTVGVLAFILLLGLLGGK